MKNKSYCLPLIAALAAFSLVSCVGGVSGPMYPAVKQSGAIQPKQGKGMVLFYFSPGFMGKYGRIPIYVDDKKLDKPMRRGGFYTYETAPETLSISSTPKSLTKNISSGLQMGTLTGIATGPFAPVMAVLGAGAGLGAAINREEIKLPVNANQIYYMDISIGTWAPKITKTNKAEAEKVLQDCHWLNAPKR